LLSGNTAKISGAATAEDALAEPGRTGRKLLKWSLLPNLPDWAIYTKN
jgi:hypothetical protein